MNNKLKNEYLKKINKNFLFNYQLKSIFYKQIDTFCELEKNYHTSTNYKIGDLVKLKQGYLLHGTRKITTDTLHLIKEYGIIAKEFYQKINLKTKYPWCASLWKIKKDMLLKDYINIYSGATIEYMKEGKDKETYTKIVPYNNLDEEIENARKKNYFSWRAEQTKEIRFMPSLALDTVQIAFILNTNNNYCRELMKEDIYDINYNKQFLKKIINRKDCLKKLLYENRDDFFTNRQAEILFGFPSCVIEGILVGRKLENNTKELKKIKLQFPKSYICNLDGIVIY